MSGVNGSLLVQTIMLMVNESAIRQGPASYNNYLLQIGVRK